MPGRLLDMVLTDRAHRLLNAVTEERANPFGPPRPVRCYRCRDASGVRRLLAHCTCREDEQARRAAAADD